MTIQTVEHSPDDAPPRLSLLPLISGGLAVVLVVVVSLSLWQGADHVREAPTGAGPAAPVATEALAREQAAAARTSRTRTTRPHPGPTLYIVGLAAQAEEQRVLIAATNATRVAAGEAILAEEVIWFDSVAAEVFFWSTMGAQQNLHVVDLRTPATG
jgi:hypothetical protein